LSNTVVRYSDGLSLLEARALFFRDAKLGPDGGYGDRWVRVETKPIPFYFPNWRSRVAAARLHDLHHLATDYETDWPGEAEIAAWEIASGCARYHAAWILKLWRIRRRACRCTEETLSRVPARTPRKDKSI
jgi:hypothetical protein